MCERLSRWPAAALDVPRCAGRVAHLITQLADNDLGTVAWARARAGFDLLVVARNDFASRKLLRRGFWEGDHIAAIEKLEANTSSWHGGGNTARRYLDIGANVGYHTLLAASKGFVVDAFEVVPRNAALINVSLCANPRLEPTVTLRRLGLSSRPRACTFVSSVQNEADAIARCDVARADDFRQAGYTVRGEFMMGTMSTMLSHSYWLAKIDVEGHEVEVLSADGADGYFRRFGIRHILAESWPEDGAPGARGALLARLVELGYSTVRTVDQAASLRTMLGPIFDPRAPPRAVLTRRGPVDVLGSHY